MEMGAAAVMANTAIATAGDIPLMATAFKQAIAAGRAAYLAKPGRVLSQGARLIFTSNRLFGRQVSNMKIDQHTDPMDYQPNMEIITSDIMEQVLAARNAYDAAVYTEASVKQALTKDHLTPDDFAALLSPAAEAF